MADLQPDQRPEPIVHDGGYVPDDELTDHEYDGIQEYDNPTPGWWHLIFFGSIVFSILYAAVWHISPMVPTHQQAVAARQEENRLRRFGELQGFALNEDKVLRISSEASWLDMGAAIFKGNCVLCHTADGSGSVGPNLTDEYYKNLTNLDEMIAVVRDGAADGAMPAQRQLDENEIALVVAYVASLRGTNLPGKEAEGELIAPFPEPIPMDAPPPTAETASAGG